jgi:hypothetical protein
MFKIYKNILKKTEKEKLFKFIKKEVKDLKGGFPCLQTLNNIYLKPEMKTFVKAVEKYIKPHKMFRCWGVCSIGDVIAWHQHNDCKYSFVYYLHNPNEEGTMFAEPTPDYDFVKYTKGVENTLLKFDSLKIHSTPNTYKKIKRYTISFDVI